jgi:hypothetical protein
MPKNSRFTINEDNWLARAWAKASQDPIIGTNQTSEMFWEKIFDYWKAFHMLEAPDQPINPQRTATALHTRRWRKHISTDCKKMDAIRKTNPVGSGENDERYFSRCMGLYHQQHGTAFRFPGCLEYLKDVPIFNIGSHTGKKNNNNNKTTRNKKKRREEIPQELWSAYGLEEEDDDDVLVGGEDEDTSTAGKTTTGTGIETVHLDMERPIGVKKAKKMAKMEGRLEKEAEKNRQTVSGFEQTMKNLDETLKKNSKRAYYMKMVDWLNNETGRENEVQAFMEKLRQMDTDEAPPEVVQERNNNDDSASLSRHLVCR